MMVAPTCEFEHFFQNKLVKLPFLFIEMYHVQVVKTILNYLKNDKGTPIKVEQHYQNQSFKSLRVGSKETNL